MIQFNAMVYLHPCLAFARNMGTTWAIPAFFSVILYVFVVGKLHNVPPHLTVEQYDRTRSSIFYCMYMFYKFLEFYMFVYTLISTGTILCGEAFVFVIFQMLYFKKAVYYNRNNAERTNSQLFMMHFKYSVIEYSMIYFTHCFLSYMRG